MITNAISDQELITSYLGGDEESLGILITRHKRKVFSSIIMLVRNKELAEDIFQDTFVKVINTLRSGAYIDEGKFLPWVIRIARNLVIDHFRREKRMQMVRDNDEYSILDTLMCSGTNVQEKMIGRQIKGELREMVLKLPYEQREVLLMRHFADMSFKEIAETTNVSINTALGRMRYALLNLRKMLTEKQEKPA